MGIPGITAHWAVFAGGPVCGQAVLVHGVRGLVSSLAAQLARWAGATVIGTVRTDAETATSARPRGLAAALRRSGGWPRAGPAASSRSRCRPAPTWDAEVTRNGTVIAGYAGPKDKRPDWGRETAGGLPKHRRATYNRLGVACLGHRVKAVVGRRSGLTQLGDAGSSTRSGGRSRS